MHEEIKKFYLSGELNEGSIYTAKERLVQYIEGLMRDYSFVPSIDNDPHWTIDYDPETEAFKFELTVYGVKVGKEHAWKTSGITGGKPIPKYTQQTKSNQLQSIAE